MLTVQGLSFRTSGVLLAIAFAIGATAPRVSAANAQGAPDAKPAGAARTAADPEVHELIARARTTEERGELAAASQLWNQAGAMLSSGPELDDCIGRGRALEMRLMLRKEVAQAATHNGSAFVELRMELFDAEGCDLDGRRTAWNDIPIDLLARATAVSRPSTLARLGLVFETLARGTKAEKEAGLVDLARLFEKREIDASDTFAAVARTRGELPPRGGYIFRDGRWLKAREMAQAASDAALEDLAKRFEAAPPSQREALRATIVKLGEPASARYAKALEARWTNALRNLTRGSTLSDLSQVAKLRAELDQRRKAALDLIFDQKRYFYPYSPPACPAEKAKLYAPVQQEVDTLVAAVHEIWKGPKRVALGPAFRAALEEIEWNRALHKDRDLDFKLPSEVPDWIAGIDVELEAIDVKSFAWNAEERAALAENRAIALANQGRWSSKEWVGLQAANSEERAEVEITNEYRAMLGRIVLSWNPKLQAAAQIHSDYMSTSGDFGHFEPDPKRHSPEDRMRLQGYTGGEGENCHMGDSGAEGAHVGWLHSSGHHRNILEPLHREMACAVSGSYWTQDFGNASEMRAAR